MRLGSELKDGKKFALLADPNSWYYYFVHEDGDFATRTTFIKKHTCLHSPKEVGEDRKHYDKPDTSTCLSCKAKARRVLYFMVPVYDFEYGTWRILDLKEFHAMNLIGDYDKLEKAAKKFAKDYTLVGDVVLIQKTSDGKSYSLTSADIDESKLEEARKLVGTGEIQYAELANFRDEEDIRKILEEADDSKVDKSVLGIAEPDDVDPKF
ncbi:single-stranded DNA-binding protein [Paenibacillus larvae]